MAKDVAADIPKAKELFDQASDILGYDLLQVCTEGPKEKLDSTAVSQPAIFVSSLAAIEKLRSEEGDVCSCMRMKLEHQSMFTALYFNNAGGRE